MSLSEDQKKQQSYRQLENSLDIFQINKNSSREDVQNLVDWIWKCYDEKQMNSISVICKRLPTYNSEINNASALQNNISQNISNPGGRDVEVSQVEQRMQPETSSINTSMLSEMSERIQPIFLEAGRLYKDKRYEDAEQKYKEVLNLCQDEQRHASYIINSKVYAGSSMMYQKKVTDAITYLSQALEVIKNNGLQDKNKNSLFFIHSTLATCYQENKDVLKMIEHWQEAISYIENNESQDNQKSLGHIYNNLGMAYASQGKSDEAINYFEKSLNIYKTIFGDEDLSIANRLNNLAEAYRNSKNYTKALELFEESLRIKRLKHGHDNDKSIANTLSNIGLTYFSMKGDYYQNCIETTQQAIDIYTFLFTQDNEISLEGKGTLANLYLQVADSYKALQNQEQSFINYEIAYDFKREAQGPKHKTTMHIAIIYAQMLFQQKKFQKSITVFEELLDAQKQLYGNNNIKIAQTLNNLGTVLTEVRNYERSYECLSEAIEIFKQDKNIDPQYIVKSEKNRDAVQKRMLKQQQKEQQALQQQQQQ